MKTFLLYLWQLPQNLLGLAVILFSRAEKHKYYCFTNYWTTRHNFGVSLGSYIILNMCYTEKDLMHEYGHQKQSKYLGWLYLPIIGIWSAVFVNLWDRIFHKKWDRQKRRTWYYSQFPERWADTLGSVTR